MNWSHTFFGIDDFCKNFYILVYHHNQSESVHNCFYSSSIRCHLSLFLHQPLTLALNESNSHLHLFSDNDFNRKTSVPSRRRQEKMQQPPRSHTPCTR
mmetsp:Transcript_8809/g.16094  ORF Transcript_8809/g.16094 Transcript_8809/m.16094 type:complete len:98 (-) Transcript_8809:463-756(-)